jgi:hypothetical protein
MFICVHLSAGSVAVIYFLIPISYFLKRRVPPAAGLDFRILVIGICLPC